MPLNRDRKSVDVVIPCLDEVGVLRQSVETTVGVFAQHPEFEWRLVIADNGSTDGTTELATQLTEEYPQVAAVFLPVRGRGLALKQAWLGSDSDIVAYMDVDLSTDIRHLPRLVQMVASDSCDIAIGSRLARGSRTKRSFKREATSRG